jgi:hypothetical protein
MSVLQSREVSPPTPSPGTRAFFLDHQGEVFCFLFVMPHRYTLAWSGNVDFAALEKEALLSYNLAHDANVSLEQATLRGVTAVTFVRPLSEQADALEEYRLSDPEAYTAYAAALKRAKDLSFARYDFYTAGSQPEHSFIADNPSRSRRKRVEVALTLSSPDRLSHGLLEWMVRHHRAADRLRKTLDVDRAAADIRAAVGSPPATAFGSGRAGS